jgi:hypothetical protein
MLFHPGKRLFTFDIRGRAACPRGRQGRLREAEIGAGDQKHNRNFIQYKRLDLP